jgi:hypothetical protein
MVGKELTIAETTMKILKKQKMLGRKLLAMMI